MDDAKKPSKGLNSIMIAFGKAKPKGRMEEDLEEDGPESEDVESEESDNELIGQALLDAFESRDPKEVYDAFEAAVRACKR